MTCDIFKGQSQNLTLTLDVDFHLTIGKNKYIDPSLFWLRLEQEEFSLVIWFVKVCFLLDRIPPRDAFMTLIVWNLQSLALFGNIELADTHTLYKTLSYLNFNQELFVNQTMKVLWTVVWKCYVSVSQYPIESRTQLLRRDSSLLPLCHRHHAFKSNDSTVSREFCRN